VNLCQSAKPAAIAAGTTVAEVIAAENAAAAAKIAAEAAAATADQDLADKTTAEAETNADLGAAINALGPDGVASVDPQTKKLSVYQPSGNGTYHITNPVPDTTVVPGGIPST